MSTSTPSRERFPSAIWFLAWNEAAERFSYYGMASILTLYMRDHLHLPAYLANAYYQWFTAAVYLTPLVGALLADKLWGRYRTILWISFAYVLGHATLALWETSSGLLVGLALIALGAGGIKPNASAFAGDQIPATSKTLIERLYNLWYWAINVGSTLGTAIIPLLLARVSPSVAFGVPGLAMALALGIFWAGRRRYVYVAPQNARTAADAATDASEPPAQGAVLRIVAVFAPVMILWSLFFQYAGAWTLQADAMDLVVAGFSLAAGQVTTLNAVFVLTLIPIMAVVVYPGLEKAGVKVTPLRKMAVGMFVPALSFAAAAAVEARLASGGPPPGVAWQVPQYFLMTVGEVLVSVTALEFAYTQAPRRMRSLVMGLWFLTIAAGSALTAVVSQLNRFEGTRPPVGYYVFFACLQLGAAIAFALVARWYPDARGTGAQPKAA